MKRRRSKSGNNKKKQPSPASKPTKKKSNKIAPKSPKRLGKVKRRKTTKDTSPSVSSGKRRSHSSVDKLASKRALQGWQTRRANQQAIREKAAQYRKEIAKRHAKYSARSKKGAATRKLREYGIEKQPDFSGEFWTYSEFHLKGDVDSNAIERIISRIDLEGKEYSILLKILIDFPGIGEKWISSPYVKGVHGISDLLLELFDTRRKKYDQKEVDEDGEETNQTESWKEAIVTIRYK